MNRLTLALILALPGLALAQYNQYNQPAQTRDIPQQAPKTESAQAAPAVGKPNIPKADCGETPQYPSGSARYAADERRKRFEGQLAKYKECMLAYIEQEKQLTLGHQDAYKGAVEQYNTTMKAINQAQEAANQ
jgi:hypothetical protein